MAARRSAIASDRHSTFTNHQFGDQTINVFEFAQHFSASDIVWDAGSRALPCFRDGSFEQAPLNLVVSPGEDR
jgi:hypothetical protein